MLAHRVPHKHRPLLHGQHLFLLRIVEDSHKLPDASSDTSKNLGVVGVAKVFHEAPHLSDDPAFAQIRRCQYFSHKSQSRRAATSAVSCCVSKLEPLGVGQLFARDGHVVVPIIMLAIATAGCDTCTFPCVRRIPCLMTLCNPVSAPWCRPAVSNGCTRPRLHPLV